MSKPAMARKKVVFPQPEGPRKQTSSPLYTSRETLSNAVKGPKFLVKFFIWRKGDAFCELLGLGSFMADLSCR